MIMRSAPYWQCSHRSGSRRDLQGLWEIFRVMKNFGVKGQNDVVRGLGQLSRSTLQYLRTLFLPQASLGRALGCLLLYPHTQIEYPSGKDIFLTNIRDTKYGIFHRLCNRMEKRPPSADHHYLLEVSSLSPGPVRSSE